MWRSRRWCGVGAVAVAVVGAAALAWPAVAVAGSGAAPANPVGPGTLVVSPSGTVTASVGTILTFTFTAPVLPPPATSVPPAPAYFVSPALIVTVSMPQGWTASTPSDLTCRPNPDCKPDGATATQFSVVLYAGANSFTLEVPATPPGSAGPASFTATEVAHANPPSTLLPVTSSPFYVVCPADGLGTMAVDPTAVAVASSGIFTFTYTAGSCGEGAGGMVGVTVPDGWTSPGPVVASAGNLTPGAPVTFTYGPAQAGSAGLGTFVAWQAAAGGPTQDLAATPVVMVTQPQVASSTATSPSPTPTSPPTSHAGGGGPTTVTSSQVTTMPSNTSTGERAGSPVALTAYGVGAGSLVLLAGTVGLLTVRSRRSRRPGERPRRGGHGTGGGNVRAVPHTGPPPSVAVRDTGTRPTLTVRLEPQAYATMTTIKEQRP